MESGIHVAIAPETLGHFLGVPVTNTLLMSWVVLALFIILMVSMGKKASMVPGKAQTVAEWVVGDARKFIHDTLEDKSLAMIFTPFLLALFFFILIGNWMEFIPGVESILYTPHGGEGEHAHAGLLRGMNTDLNIPLALAIIAFLTIETAGIAKLGFFKYISRFFNFHSPIGFFVGLLELMSELIRLVSFSFRLFGNIFAGMVLLLVIKFLVPYVAPVPFILFEMFVGLIQAAVFTLLTLFFIKLAITDPHASH
jgi:F-type H+-transporting ATPase subunit a